MSDRSNAAPPDGSLGVAYILHRFPYLTETFIAREMFWIQRHGVEVSVFSLMRPRHPAASPEARALAGRAHYSRGLSRRLLQAQARFLRRSPAAYFRALARVVAQTYREPKVLALALALFPKSVLFAAMIEDRGIRHVHANFVWLEALAAGIVRDLIGTTFTINPHAFGLFGRDRVNVRRQLASATHVVTISEFHRSFITDLCPTLSASDVSVVHCGVDTSLMSPRPDRPASAPPRILSVGRWVEKKGHEYLIEACAILRDRGLSFDCQIVLGDDDGCRHVQQLVDRHGLRSHVTLVGALGQDEVLGRYRASEIFALACVVAADGDRDGIPVSLMEAMACELPVVTTGVAGIPELVQDGESGLLIPERDAPALADALECLIRLPELRTRLGRAGRRVVQAGFEAQQTAADMAQVFRRLTDTAEPAGIGGPQAQGVRA